MVLLHGRCKGLHCFVLTIPWVGWIKFESLRHCIKSLTLKRSKSDSIRKDLEDAFLKALSFPSPDKKKKGDTRHKFLHDPDHCGTMEMQWKDYINSPLSRIVRDLHSLHTRNIWIIWILSDMHRDPTFSSASPYLLLQCNSRNSSSGKMNWFKCRAIKIQASS